MFLKYAVEHPLTPGRGSLVGRTALERKTVHMPDCLADPEYVALEYQSVGRYRSNLGVPLLREGVPIGVIILMRAVVMPFTDRQIELVTTFADQAVIAIENVSLFDEVQAKTRDLAESLQQQTATADVLKVISRSTVRSANRCSIRWSHRAAQLCEADDCLHFLQRTATVSGLLPVTALTASMRVHERRSPIASRARHAGRPRAQLDGSNRFTFRTFWPTPNLPGIRPRSWVASARMLGVPLLREGECDWRDCR